jgi:P-type Ca2+ transporter type 2B
MANEPLRVIGLAYIEMDEGEWMGQYENGRNAAINMEAYLEQGNQIFTWIGAFGMKDPLRANVKQCVRYAREQGHLSIRLVSGDHIETAKAVAIKAGILKPEEAGRSYAVMSGEQFRELVGKLTQQRGEIAGVEQVLENMSSFQEIASNIRVLARATP